MNAHNHAHDHPGEHAAGGRRAGASLFAAPALLRLAGAAALIAALWAAALLAMR